MSNVRTRSAGEKKVQKPALSCQEKKWPLKRRRRRKRNDILFALDPFLFWVDKRSQQLLNFFFSPSSHLYWVVEKNLLTCHVEKRGGLFIKSGCDSPLLNSRDAPPFSLFSLSLAMFTSSRNHKPDHAERERERE